MYDFSQKKQLKRRANVAHIPMYRSLLATQGNPAANWKATNQQELAGDLLYVLLDFYSIEEIEERASSPRREAAPEPTPTGNTFTEKPGIAPALSSAWRTVSSRIASAAGSVFKSSKN